MASCQILWKSLRESAVSCSENGARKMVDKRNFNIFRHTSWWKNTFGCGLLTKIHIVVVAAVEKFYQIRPPIGFMKFTIST